MDLFIRSIPAWLELVFLAFAIGTLACRLWVLPPASTAELPDPKKSFVRLRLLFPISIFATLASSVAKLLVRAAEMSGNPVSAVFPALPAVILKTHFGLVWIIRISGLVLLLVTVKTVRQSRDSRVFLYFLLFIGVIIAMTESASGHAADKGDFSVAEIMDWLHLLGALVWGGGLFVLSLVILQPANIVDRAARFIAGSAAGFSRIAGIAVGTILLSAFYHAWVYVGSLDALVKSPYGRTIIAKIVLFFPLLLLGAYNRSISAPRLREWAGLTLTRLGIVDRLVAPVFQPVASDLKGRRNAVRFVRMVRTEAVLMLGLLFCVALLRHEVPAKHFLHLEHAGVSDGHADHDHEAHLRHVSSSESVVPRLETDPAAIIAGTPVTITVRLEDGKGGPLQGMRPSHERILHAIIVGKDLDVFAHIHPEDQGMLTDTMMEKATFPLRFTFPKAGRYLMGIDFATEDGVYVKTTTISVSGHPDMGEPKIDFSRSKNFGPYRVMLTTSPERIKAGEETTLTYSIHEEGRPVRDLQPYLGAAMHIAVLRTDLTQFMHIHGAAPEKIRAGHDHIHIPSSEKFGPTIDAAMVFPVKGMYKIFSQTRREEKILLFDFMVEVQ